MSTTKALSHGRANLREGKLSGIPCALGEHSILHQVMEKNSSGEDTEIPRDIGDHGGAWQVSGSRDCFKHVQMHIYAPTKTAEEGTKVDNIAATWFQVQYNPSGTRQTLWHQTLAACL